MSRKNFTPSSPENTFLPPQKRLLFPELMRGALEIAMRLVWDSDEIPPKALGRLLEHLFTCARRDDERQVLILLAALAFMRLSGGRESALGLRAILEESLEPIENG